MKIRDYQLDSPIILAPMAGITDQPFRELCLHYGADMAVSEMMSSNPKMWNTAKSQNRIRSKERIRSVQIAGSDPDEMAIAAQYCEENGAHIVDINMGCPAKKVNKKLAGSALLQHPILVEKILKAIVSRVDIPVTLKVRTGWSLDNKNALEIAHIAQACGIEALTIHGRTKACLFKGQAEYETIKAVKAQVDIPIIANGDICNAMDVKRVLEQTKADGIMIGRASQGQPWLFKQIKHYLNTGCFFEIPIKEKSQVIVEHIQNIHAFYGEHQGVRISRKHVAWYYKTTLSRLENDKSFDRAHFNQLDTSQAQIDTLNQFLFT